MDSLDDHLLGLIFVGLGPGRLHGGVVTLVCKRWRRAYFDEPRLWRSLWLVPGPMALAGRQRAGFRRWLAGRHRLLQRVARHVQELGLDDSWGAMSGAAAAAALTWHTGRLLTALQPHAVRRLTVWWPSGEEQPPPAARAARALRCLPGLTSLCIDADNPPASICAALSCLEALEDLSCRASRLPPGTLAAASRLQRMTRLRLASTHPLPPLEPLCALTRLRHLELHQRYGVLVLPSLQPLLLLRLFDMSDRYSTGEHVLVSASAKCGDDSWSKARSEY